MVPETRSQFLSLHACGRLTAAATLHPQPCTPDAKIALAKKTHLHASYTRWNHDVGIMLEGQQQPIRQALAGCLDNHIHILMFIVATGIKHRAATNVSVRIGRKQVHTMPASTHRSRDPVRIGRAHVPSVVRTAAGGYRWQQFAASLSSVIQSTCCPALFFWNLDTSTVPCTQGEMVQARAAPCVHRAGWRRWIA